MINLTAKMLNRLAALLLLLLAPVLANAQAFGPQLTYHGRILDTAASNAPVTGNVQFLIQVVHPDVPTCVLYQETQTQNLTAADGNFTLTVNGGSSTLPVALLNPFADIFITDPTRTINCINGGTVPGTTNSRRLNVFFVPPGGSAYEPLPSQAINYVPLAIEALNTNAVGGFGAPSLLRVVEINGFGVPVPYAVPAITRPLYEELDATIKGQSNYYVTSQGTVAYFSVPLSGEVTGSQSATVVSRLFNRPLNPAGGTYVGGEVMFFDGTNWIAKPGIAGTVQTVNSTNAYLTVSGGPPTFDPTINPLLTLHVGTTANTVAAGNDSRIVNAFSALTPLVGDVTGLVSATVVATVGGKTAAQISQSVSDTIQATSANTASTIVKRDGSGNVSVNTISSTNTSTRNLLLYNAGNTNYAGFAVSSGLALDYVLTMPTTAPVSGFVLATDGGGNTSWISPTTGSVTSVSASAPLSSSGGFTPTISITRATPTVDGYLAASDFVTFNNKITSVTVTSPLTMAGTSLTPQIGLQDSGVSAGTYTKFTVDIKGLITSATTLIASDIPDLDTSKITTGVFPIARGGTGAGALTGNGFVAVNASGSALTSTVCGANEVPVFNGSAWTCILATSVSSTSTLVMRDSNGDFTANNITTVQDMTVQRNLRVQDGQVGGYIGLTTPVGVANYDIVLPANGVPVPGNVLAIAAGATSSVVTTQWITALTDVLASGAIIVGNTSGTATPVFMSGDATLASSGVLTLVDVGAGVTSGTEYTKVTVDGKGRVTSGAQLTNADINTALGYVPVSSVSATTPITLTGGASNPVIGLADSGVASGAYGSNTLIPNFVIDQWGRITSATQVTYADATNVSKGIVQIGANITLATGVISVTSGNVISALGYTPFDQAATLSGDVTGVLSATVVSAVGGKTASEVATSVNDTQAATHLNSSSTIVRRDANGDFTANNITTVQDMTVQRNLRVQDGQVGGYIGLTTPVGISNYDIVLPSNGAPSTGQVLAVASGSTSATIRTHWINALTDVLAPGNIFVGNASGTATGVTMTGDATMSDTGNFQLVSVGAGVTSGTQYTKVTVDGKGRVTSGAQLDNADVVAGLGYSPVSTVSATTPISITGGASNPVIGLNNSGVVSGSYGSNTLIPNFIVDVWGRIVSATTTVYADATTSSKGIIQIGDNLTVSGGVVSITTANIVSAMGSLSGDVSGNLNATVVDTVGGRTAAQIATTVDTVASATHLNSSGTIVRRDANGNFTANNITTVQDMTVQRNLRVQDGSAGGYIGFTTPVGVSNYDIVLPGNGLPTLGQVLSVASGTTSATVRTQWINALSDILAPGYLFVGNASGTATAMPITGDVTLSSTGNVQLVGVGAGVTSGAQYTKVTVDGKGRVTSGAQLNNADVVAGLGYEPMNSVAVSTPLSLTGGASNPTISLNTSGVVSGSYGSNTLIPNFIVDVWGRIVSATTTVYADATTSSKGIIQIGDNLTVSGGVVSITTANIVSAMGSLSGDVSGNLNATVVDTVGGRTAANIATTVDTVASATHLNSSGTIVRRDANGNFTANNITTVQDMTVQRNLRVQDGSVGGYIGLTTPVGVSNYDIVLPNNGAPSTGQVLAVASGSTSATVRTNWINALTDVLAPGYLFVGNASGTATGVAVTGDLTLSNTGNFQLVGVGAGVTSGAQYTKVTVDGKGRVTSGALLNNADVVAALGYTPADDAVSGTYLRRANDLSDLNSSATARTNLGLGTFATANTLDLGGASATGIIADARLQDFAGVVSGTQYTKLTVDGKGRVTSGAQLDNSDVTTALGYTPVNLVSATSPITLTGTASNPVVGLENSGVAVGTYPKVTVDIWGRVTSGTVLNFADVTTGLGYTPVQMVSATAPLVLSGPASSPVISLAMSGVTSGTYPKVTVDDFGRVTSGTGLSNADVVAGLGYTPTNVVSAAAPLSISGGASNPVVTLNTSGVTSGTYPKVTVDDWGRVTSGSVLSFADVTTGLGYSPVALVSATAPIVLTGSASMPSIGMANSGVIAATYGSDTLVPFFTVDAFGRITSAGAQAYADATGTTKGIVQIGSNITLSSGVISVTSANVIAAVGSLAGDVSGTLDATVVETVGGRTAANIATTVDAVASATHLNSSGTIVRRDANGDFTARNITTIQDITVYGNMRVQNGLTGGSIGITTPVGLAPIHNYNIVLPDNVTPTVNQLLAVASGSTSSTIYTRWMTTLSDALSPGNIFVGNASGVATGMPLTGDATLSSTGNLQLNAVGAGITSGTVYTKVTVDGKGRVTSGAQLANADIVAALGYTPADDAASGTYLVKASNLSDLTSSATARTNLGLGTFATASFLDLGSASATGIIADARLPDFANVTSGTQYTKLTVDGKGRVTSGANLSNADINTALGYVPMASVSTTAPITMTGGSSNPVIGLENSGVTVGTYPKVTVDIWGRVTSGTVLNFADVTTGLGYTPVEIVSATAPLFLTGPASSPVINLATSGVTSGTYPKVTVDAWGRVTSGTGLNNADVVAGLGYTPTNVVSTTSPLSISGGASNPVISLDTTGVTSGTYPKVTVDAWGRVTSGTGLNYTDVTTGLGYVPVEIVSATSPLFLTGTSSSPVINLANSGVTAGTYGSSTGIPFVTVDAYGRVTSAGTQAYADATAGTKGIVQIGSNITVTAGTISVTSANVIAAMGTLGGDVSGTLNNTVVQTVGGRTAANIATTVDAVASATHLNSSGTIVRRDANGDFTARNITLVEDMTVWGNMRVQNGLAGGAIGITTPVTLGAAQDYNIVLPDNGAPNAGQVLGVVSGSTASLIRTTWVNALTDYLADGHIYMGNGSNIATGVLVSGDATMANTGALTLASVGAGVTSGAQYTKVTVDGKGRVVSGAQLNNADVVSGLGYTPAGAVSTTAPVTLTGTVSAPVIGLANSGVTAGTYNKVTVDALGRVTSSSALTAADVTTALTYTPVNRAGDTMTGGLTTTTLSATTIIASGTIAVGTPAVTPGAIVDISSTAAGFLIPRMTTTQRDAIVSGAAQDGLQIFNTTTRAFEYYDGGAVTWRQMVTNNTALTSLNGSTSSTQFFATGTAGTSFNVVTAAGMHTFNMPMAAAAGVTQGALSNTQYQTFVDKVTSVSGASGQIVVTGGVSSPIVGLANSGVTAATYGTSAAVPVITVDAFGRITSVTNTVLRPASAADTGVVSIGNNITVNGAGQISLTSANVLNAFGAGLSGDVTGSLSATVVATVGGKTAAQITTAVNDVASATDQNSSGTIVRRDANGDFIANNITTVQDMTVERYLRVRNGAAGSSVGIFVPVLSPSYNIILPNNSSVPPAGYGLGIASATAGDVYTTWVPMMSASIASGAFYVGNASGTAAAVLMSGDATLSNTGNLQLVGVGSGVTSGTQYTKVTVDGKGRVTSGAQLANSDVTTALGYTPAGVVSVTAPVTLTGTVSAPVIGLANSGVSAGTYNKVTVDVFGRVTSSSALTATDVTTALTYTPVNRAGDTMSGTLIMPANGLILGTNQLVANNGGVGIGTASVTNGAMLDISSTNKGVLFPRLTTAQRGSVSTVTGMQIFNTDANAIEYYDGSQWRTVVTNLSALTSLNGSTSATQSFATGSAGTSFNIVTAAGQHTFNMPMAATAGVTQGALTNTQYQSFVDKVTAVSGVTGQIVITGGTSSPVVGLANSGVTAATYSKVTVDAFGRVTSGTNITAADIPNLAGDVTGNIATNVVATVGGKTSAQISQSVSDTLTATHLNTANMLMKRDATGAVSAGAISQSQAVLRGSTAGTVTLQTPASVTSYGLTFPAAQGAANQVLSNDGAGLLSWINVLPTTLANGAMFIGNGSGVASAVVMSGDATISNSGVLTLASTVTAGSVGTASAVPTINFDAKGRITSVSSQAYQDATATLKGILNVPAAGNLTVTGGAISLTGSGVVSALGTQSAATFFAGPTAGGAANPSFRAIASTDLPTTGVSGVWVNGGNAFGTATSIGTNDNNSLVIKTNNVTRATIDTTGVMTASVSRAAFSGQAYAAVNQLTVAANAATADANLGNVMRMTTTTAAVHTVTVNNIQPGAAYTLSVTGAGANTGQINIVCTGATGTSYIPANGPRVSGGTSNKTIYTFVYDGEHCLVTWITGF